MSIHMRAGLSLLLLDTGLGRSPILVFSSWVISGAPSTWTSTTFSSVLKPFLEDVIRDVVLQTKDWRDSP